MCDRPGLPDSVRGRLGTMARRSRRTQTPLPALLVLLFCSGLLVPLFLVGVSEDDALSESTTGRVFPGGDTTTVRRGGGPLCRDAPVEFEVNGQTYSDITAVRGIECPTDGSVETEIRYDPDDPAVFSTMEPQQPWMYGFAAVAALGFLATLVALLRRIVSRLRRGRG